MGEVIVLLIIIGFLIMVVAHQASLRRKAEIEAAQAKADRCEDWAYLYQVPVSHVEMAFKKFNLHNMVHFRDWEGSFFKQWFDDQNKEKHRQATIARNEEVVSRAMNDILEHAPFSLQNSFENRNN